MATHRTPISALQEFCVKRGITPIYELVSSEGPIHQPNYIYMCTAGSFSAFSNGSSKKKAKHQASYLVLLKMLSSSVMTDCEQLMLRDVHVVAANLLGTEFMDSIETDDPQFAAFQRARHEAEEGNFVGQLQEVCQKNMWPPPTYEFVEYNQLAHLSQDYHCKVKLWQWECDGHGSSKKIAKRNAAGNLLENLVSKNLTIPAEALESMEEANLSLINNSSGNNNKDLKHGLDEPRMEVEQMNKIVSKAMHALWHSNGRKLQPVLVDAADCETDPVKKLDETLTTLQLTVVYTYVRGSQPANNIYCLAQLSTKPPQVIKSVAGPSLEAAREHAAYRCLLFLHAMTQNAPRIDYALW